MNVIKVDDTKCDGCKTCYKACWLDVIRWNDETDRPLIAYAQDCVECNYCEISCPQDAIEVSIDYSKPFPDVYIPSR
jgi:NAD-dependent dihydropyrimidine dehydrogenase PreA subunit